MSLSFSLILRRRREKSDWIIVFKEFVLVLYILSISMSRTILRFYFALVFALVCPEKMEAVVFASFI